MKNLLPIGKLLFLLVASCLFVTSTSAETLTERVEEGKTIRLGFANEIPWAYPGENNTPLGFANAITIGILNHMGYTKIEPVVTEWGGLIPGLKAKRFDIITGGMYILNSRCQNIEFSEPIGKFGDAFIVAKGNPKGIQNYKDIIETEAIMVTGAGYNTVEAAKKEEVPDDHVMQVPGPTEILAAVKAGRADAGAMPYFTALNLAKENQDIEVTDPSALPEWTLNYVGIGFRAEDNEFMEKFNKARAEYLASETMMQDVAEYGYTTSQLPGEVTTEWACHNR